MDLSPDSSTNTDADREEDKSVEAMKTRLGPLPLLCLVTILNLINGFFCFCFFSCHRKAGKINTESGKEMSVSYGCAQQSNTVCTNGRNNRISWVFQVKTLYIGKVKLLTIIKLYAMRRTASWMGWIGKKLLEHHTDLLSIIEPI